jgi:DeoR family transcriptional regulator of aga operon
LMARQASRVVIVADSSKAGRRAFARICAAREIDALVTDAGIDPDQQARLKDAGIDVVIA